jgi:hypothetical protein
LSPPAKAGVYQIDEIDSRFRGNDIAFLPVKTK